MKYTETSCECLFRLDCPGILDGSWSADGSMLALGYDIGEVEVFHFDGIRLSSRGKWFSGVADHLPVRQWAADASALPGRTQLGRHRRDRLRYVEHVHSGRHTTCHDGRVTQIRSVCGRGATRCAVWDVRSTAATAAAAPHDGRDGDRIQSAPRLTCTAARRCCGCGCVSRVSAADLTLGGGVCCGGIAVTRRCWPWRHHLRVHGACGRRALQATPRGTSMAWLGLTGPADGYCWCSFMTIWCVRGGRRRVINAKGQPLRKG